jgi:hypothetical protein
MLTWMRMIYDNEKLNEIYRDTWPNLGWAKMDTIKVGNTVKFLGCSPEQVRWGSNDDPTGILIVGDKYYVEHVYIHSQHTKIELRGVKGKFNSVCFEVTDAPRKR